MNKKGQTLILFVLLVPIFVALAAVVVDVGTMQFTYQKYKGIVDESIKEYYEDNSLAALEETLKLNDIPKEEYQVIEENYRVKVSISHEMEAIFGKIIGLETYEITLSREGRLENDRVILT